MIERIILASASPRRKEMLEKFGIRFEVIPSDADENISTDMSHDAYDSELARIKGREVEARLLEKGEDLSHTLIISCDTIVSFDGRIIGKPHSRFDAELTLNLLSDSWHDVYSGLSLIYGGECIVGYEKTRVLFSELNPADIKKYVESGASEGKAGSYGIQDTASAFVSRIEGDYSNIVGFPLALFARMLRESFGATVFELGDIK